MRIELLTLISEDDHFCNTRDDFMKLLELDSRVSLAKENGQNTFVMDDGGKSVDVSIEVNLSKSTDGNDKLYYVTLQDSTQHAENKLIMAMNLVQEIASRLHKNAIINILSNDVYTEYAIEGYKLINKVENELRRFITTFTLEKVGFEWIARLVPPKVHERNRTDETVPMNDFLHNTYFTDLKSILFSANRPAGYRSLDDLEKFLKNKRNTGESLNIEDFDDFISKSFWDRYFSHIEKNRKTLETNMDNLAGLRNDVAHNRFIDKEKLGKIRGISTKILNVIQKAMNEIPKTSVSTMEKEVFINKTVQTFRHRRAKPTTLLYEMLKSNLPEAEISDSEIVDFVIHQDGATSIAKYFGPKYLEGSVDEALKYIGEILSYFKDANTFYICTSSNIPSGAFQLFLNRLSYKFPNVSFQIMVVHASSSEPSRLVDYIHPDFLDDYHYNE